MMFVVVILLAVIVMVLCGVLIGMKRQLKEVRKINRMRKAFMLNVRHEVRAPVNSLHMLAKTVAKEDLYLSKNEKRDIADQMEYNSNLISTLVDEALLFADFDDEGHPLHDELFSPNALCRRCLEANMYSIYHRQAVKLNFKRQLNDEFFFKSDRHMVELVLNKLILNACRFTEVGEVTVGCTLSENEGWLTFYVADTGNGIPQNRLSSIFTWFEEPDKAFDEAELDLSICQRLAQKLGGYVAHDNQNTHGTRMLLVLPLKK